MAQKSPRYQQFYLQSKRWLRVTLSTLETRWYRCIMLHHTCAVYSTQMQMPHVLNIQMKGLHYVVKFSMWAKQCHKPSPKSPFFLRASERRVLLKVGVCYTSSHVHIFITSSHRHIVTSSHLLSLSLALMPSVRVSLLLFSFPS